MSDKPEPQDKRASTTAEPASDAKASAAPAQASAASEAPVASQPPGTPPESPPPRKSRNRGKTSGFRWGSFLFGVLLLAGLGALGWMQWQHQQQSEGRLAELSQSVQAEGEQQLADVSSNLDRVQAEARSSLEQARQQAEAGSQQARQLQQQMQAQLEEQSQNLEQQVRSLRQQVQAISTTTTEDWKLAEAYYLTRLAGQRLLMERDMGSALALMEAADRIVRDYPDPDLFPVREALAKDIADLRLAEGVDREGIYLQIAALGDQLEELPLAEPQNFVPDSAQTGAKTENTSAEDPAAQGWWQSVRASFAAALEKLKSFVRITRHDQAPAPLLSPERQLYLRSGVQTALDTAQLALLREQQEIYQHSIGKAAAMVRELYADSPERATLLNGLEQLSATRVSQKLPDISDSQQALGNYLEQRHRLAPKGNGGENAGARS